jgi:Flp pilus assembly protein CpaB
MMGIIAVLAVAVAVFGFLVLAEIFGWFEKAPEIPNEPDQPEEKFKTAQISVPSKDIHAGDLILINVANPYVFPEEAPTIFPVTFI